MFVSCFRVLVFGTLCFPLPLIFAASDLCAARPSHSARLFLSLAMSVLSEAFSGLGLFSSSSESSPKAQESQHGIFVRTQMVPAVTRLQKETRGRKLKDVHTSLQEAILALKNFQHEEWPPRKPPPTPPDNDTVVTQVSDEDDDDVTAEGKTDSKVGKENETDSVSKDTAAESPNEDETNGDAAASVKSRVRRDDDPQTREPVHSSVEATFEAVITLLNHQSRTPKTSEVACELITLIISNRYFSGRAGGQDDMSGSGSWAKAEGEDTKPASLLHRLLEALSTCAEQNVETVQTALIKTLRTIMTSAKCGVHESSMLTALRTTFHVYLVTSSPACKSSAKLAMVDMIRSAVSRMEAYDAVARSQALKPTAENKNEDLSDSSSQVSVAAFASQYHTDTFVLFRALCKVSAKELPADNDAEPERTRLFATPVTTDPMELHSKVIALELILSTLDFCGSAFYEGEKFVYLVQQYLSASLLKNCMSNHTQIAFLSQKIFLVLVYKFKGHLKQEIEVFLSNIFLRVLDSPNSSFKQKALVLESLRSLCGDPVLLTQIFLNYDCDFDAMNLYKDIVHMLTKLGGKATSNPSSVASKKDAEQDAELSLAGLEVLVTIMKAFLRALGLPGGTVDDESDDSAGARIRGMLQLDVGLAATPDDPRDMTSPSGSVCSDDVSSSEPGVRPMTKSSDVAGKIVDAFQMKRNAEQNFEIGAVKFTLSLKSGLTFFVENGFVELDAQKIALFFLANKDKLDKTQMGEALGREPDAGFVKDTSIEADKGGRGFWVRILHHYVDALDFTGLMFDDAIRLFLSGFRLPGEAQKIDRIMEKFAERFTAQNPGVFPSADTAFILAFSIIMLNTDLHNPSIKPERRMTIDSFIRNNRGIGENGGDLPDDFLTAIYYRIKDRPFSLKEDDAARERAETPKQLFDASFFFEGKSFFGSSAEERKRERFKQERDEMLAVTEQFIRRKPDKALKPLGESVRFTETVAPSDVVKPMFDVTWGPLLGVISQVLECSDDERIVAVCLNGFVYAVRISSHSNMSLARDTFVSSLAKFTYLGSIKEMKRKNVESIRTLLSIAVMDGEYLGESWGPVLQCISQLARLRLSASGLDSDESFLVDRGENGAPSSSSSSVRKERSGLFNQTQAESLAKEAEETNGRVVLEAVQEVLLDKVFSATVHLSAPSLAHFIEQLIEVSWSEISGNSKRGITGVDSIRIAVDGSRHSRTGGDGPSIFSLQRLVEVADYNMDVRPRLVWAQVWERMADYFAELACHKNAMVSAFAIDSLKQLSIKFLDKPELSEFNFQRLFLKPFLVVMDNKESREDTRELVLRCIDNIIRTKSHNLRSGWKIFFSILTRSASDPSERVDYMGLRILQHLLDDHLDNLFQSEPDGEAEDARASTQLSPHQNRSRNADAEDFVELCKASLAFLKYEGYEKPRPTGLSITAFSHTAVYADLLAKKRVMDPVSGAQWTDPDGIGYTYKNLPENERLQMVLWRPLLEGLASSICSPVRIKVGGVGCLVQRAGILSLRAILLRHGHLFSDGEWAALLTETLLPAIQSAAEADLSPVLDMTSESPSASSIDFLVDTLPLPPPPDDVGLLRFEAIGVTPNRSLGTAELMLEASFTDLRHGGDGDLRKAYILARKASLTTVKSQEQPFPESWLATSAPIALCLITDITSEIIMRRGQGGRELLWPVVAQQYKLWALGRYEDNKMHAGDRLWRPCEAVVRIACREIARLFPRLESSASIIGADEVSLWTGLLLNLVSEMIAETVEIEELGRTKLKISKQRATDVFERRINESISFDSVDEDMNVRTPYGDGLIEGKRVNVYPLPNEKGFFELEMNIIKLSFGGTLFAPGSTSIKIMQNGKGKTESSSNRGSDIPHEVSVPRAYWKEIVPDLKVRSVVAYSLQKILVEDLGTLIHSASVESLSLLLHNLNRSRLEANAAVNDEQVSMAFQESLLNEWGDSIAAADESEEAAARLSLQHGSSIFFLNQESEATKAMINMLSALYISPNADPVHRARESFAELHLMQLIKEVLEKFMESEERDGHLVDDNFWRTGSNRGAKIAIYCTTFASVVVEILRVIKCFRTEQFAKQNPQLFPKLCALIKTQSAEIREVLHEILTMHIATLLGLRL